MYIAQEAPGAPAEHAEYNVLGVPLAEVIVGLIAFGVLLFVLTKFVFPRMESMFQQRVEAIEGGLVKAEKAQAEAAALLSQYKAQLAEARTEAARIRDEARADAEGIRADVLGKAREESDRIIAAGREQLAGERASIVRELRTEMGSLAVSLAGKIVGESLEDEARRRGTVERALADLESAGAR